PNLRTPALHDALPISHDRRDACPTLVRFMEEILRIAFSWWPGTLSLARRNEGSGKMPDVHRQIGAADIVEHLFRAARAVPRRTRDRKSTLNSSHQIIS